MIVPTCSPRNARSTLPGTKAIDDLDLVEVVVEIHRLHLSTVIRGMNVASGCVLGLAV